MKSKPIKQTKGVKEQARLRKKEGMLNREWYSLRSILGYNWAIFYMLLGGREAGKSYACTHFFVSQFVKYGRPFYWLRLSDASAKKLLQNNAEKLIDPDLRREFNLDLVTNGTNVYRVEQRDDKGKILRKTLMCRVLNLATFYNDKGSGLFDKDFINDPNMYYNICLDEMQREANEKKTFDILYAFTNQIENLIRSTKIKTRIICIGNTLEEASDLMCAFNFLPEDFGRYKLVKNKKLLLKFIEEMKAAKTDEDRAAVNKKYKDIDFGKRCVVEYIEPNDAYKTRRKHTVADILQPDASTFTNKVDTDNTLVFKGRLLKPEIIIKFRKTKDAWFTIWDSGVVKQYNGEKCRIISMRPYLDELFNTEQRDSIIQLFDTRSFKYANLITFKEFQKQIELLKPRK